VFHHGGTEGTETSKDFVGVLLTFSFLRGRLRVLRAYVVKSAPVLRPSLSDSPARS